MKKICILTSAHPAFDTRIFYKEAKTLAKVGYDVTLIVQHDKNELVDGVKIIAPPKPRNRFFRIFFLTRKVYRLALHQKANAYHFHDPELIPTGLLLKLQGKKVIYDVHEDVPRQILSKHWIVKLLRKPTAWLVERVENFTAKRFDAVVAATPFIQERFKRLNCNAVNVNNFPILSEIYLPNVDWSKKGRAVCYVGGIAEFRGIYEMIGAVEQTDVKLLLAGQFSSASERNRAVAMPGWSKVEELGQLNRNEVKEVLLRSIAGLVLFHPTPDHTDAQPTKMFEYMATGLPVIASNFPLWKEIIKGNKCGVCVNPLDPKEIAKAVEYLIEHPNEAKKMGENGRAAVLEKYNWENESKKLLKVYEELLSK